MGVSLSAAFNAFPDTLKFDPLTGDFGTNFFGHAANTATYIVANPDFGWLEFGGKMPADSRTLRVTPMDSFGSRVYVAPLVFG